MRTPTTILAACLLAGQAASTPAPSMVFARANDGAASPPSGYAGPYAVNLIEAMVPKSKDCVGAEKPDECRTAAQAAPFFIDAFAKHKIYSYWEIAAVLSLTAHESAAFKFKQNKINGPTTGQGTSNMQSAKFHCELATSDTQLSSKAKAIMGSTACSATTGAQGVQLLELLSADEYNFSTGAWFLATKCDATIRENLQAGKPDAWMDYNLKCVGVPKEPTGSEIIDENKWMVGEWKSRRDYWAAAKTAFGLVDGKP